jgi:CRP-like cAMP-binding protein
LVLDAAPDLASSLTADERRRLEQVSVPVVAMSSQGSLAVEELLERRAAFAAIVVEGLVLHHLATGGNPGLRILGPGDTIMTPLAPGPTFLGSSRYVAQSSARLALLGDEFLIAAHGAPHVLVGLQAAAAEQMERLSLQLVICQLPRVADRVLAMLWLLAESFGRVTPAGTRLPLSLTHEVLGALVGARRPTVTLALGELADRGALVHQDLGWLLLQRPALTATGKGTPGPGKGPLEPPRLLDETPSEWAASGEVRWDTAETLVALTDTVKRLRDQHTLNIEQFRKRLGESSAFREQAIAVREQAVAVRKRTVSRRGVTPPP